jgi:hypothetical protein
LIYIIKGLTENSKTQDTRKKSKEENRII